MSVLTMPRFLPVRPAAGRMETGRLAASLRRGLRTWLTRQALPDLTARELADIGVSPAMAVAEAARLPWDIASRSRPATGIAATLQRALEHARIRHLTAQRVPYSAIELTRSAICNR